MKVQRHRPFAEPEKPRCEPCGELAQQTYSKHLTNE